MGIDIKQEKHNKSANQKKKKKSTTFFCITDTCISPYPKGALKIKNYLVFIFYLY